MREKQMTERELEDYFWKVFDVTADQKEVIFNARKLWHQICDNVCDKYGEVPVAPTNLCESFNPFTIHFTWDNKCGDVLGFSINEKPEVYSCCNHTFFVRDEKGGFITKCDTWKEYLTLPDIKMSEKLMEMFYLCFVEKNNGY